MTCLIGEDGLVGEEGLENGITLQPDLFDHLSYGLQVLDLSAWYKCSRHIRGFWFSQKGPVLYVVLGMVVVGLVYLVVFGIAAWYTPLGFAKAIISSANVFSSINVAFFTAAITGHTSKGSAWINLWRISSSLAPTLFAIVISSWRKVDGLPVICFSARNFSNISCVGNKIKKLN